MEYAHVLEPAEQRELLRIARATLREHLRTGRTPPGRPHRESLLAPAAVFVTLRRGEALRGCIGTTVAAEPLFASVQAMAISAATADPRFPPVVADELADLGLEISVLGQARPITGADDVQIGRDGLVVEGRGRRGLLLPQVAPEAGWDAVAFLDATCHKAGLPAGAWRDRDVRVTAFTAQVFSEAALAAATPSR